ncbi:MAG TPA: GntR family transcriptional regulator [Pseudorhodoplanes sp.]|jgi:DNA-binding GntR family transcriptional regulator|nr:GntR family transcriptional regulator [Pseudorhodoplanes sp.]
MRTQGSASLKDEIENEIVAGRFQPGERLDEVSLAERYKVSRTPIREALHALAASGLVEVRPHRGTIVSEVSPDRLVEMFEVMAELEAMCGRLAARRMTEAEHRALREAHAACGEAARAGDSDRYYYDNERFHFCIYEGSHNGFLAEQSRTLHRRLQAYRRLQLRVRNRLATSYKEHGDIVAAILAGDGDRAAQHLRRHVAVQGERFADLVSSLRTLKQPAVSA